MQIDWSLARRTLCAHTVREFAGPRAHRPQPNRSIGLHFVAIVIKQNATNDQPTYVARPAGRSHTDAVHGRQYRTVGVASTAASGVARL